MYDPLAENTRVINVPGTDAMLQVLRKKDKTFILPLSKEKLRGSPDSWAASVLGGTLIYSTLFIWATVLAPVLFPLMLLCSPIFILATVLGMRGLNNFLLTDPAQEEATAENARDFNNVHELPEVSVEKNLLNSSEREIIESYRSAAFKDGKKREIDYVTDRNFTALFKNKDSNSHEAENETEEPVMVEVEESFLNNRKNL